jgi:hypothetical protein
MQFFFWLIVLIATLLSVVGCADSAGAVKGGHELKHPGPLKNYGQSV